jgi:hypothetical protein
MIASVVVIFILMIRGGATAQHAWARARAWLLSCLVELWKLEFFAYGCFWLWKLEVFLWCCCLYGNLSLFRLKKKKKRIGLL